MNRPRHAWRLVAVLLALGLLSGVAGLLVGLRLARQQIDARNDPDTWNVHVAAEFDRLVHPTPEQRPRVAAHLEAAVRDLRELRRDTITRSTNIIWRLVREVEAELTPEQRRAFEAMKPGPSDLTLDLLNVSPAPNP